MRGMRRFALVLAIATGCGGGSTAASDGSSGDDGKPPGDGDSDGTDGNSDGQLVDADLTDGNLSCPQGTWCSETAPIASTLLHGVFAVSAGDVFAVGDGGTIVRRAANTWTQMTSTTNANLRGVWAANSNDAWAVGENGALLRWNGSQWQQQNGVTTSNLDAVWGSSATDVWMCGPNTVIHYNGSTFTSPGSAGICVAISGTGPTDIWFTATNIQPHHYTGTFATIATGAGSNQFFGVFALAANNVWVGSAVPGKQGLNATTAQQLAGTAAWTGHSTSPNAIFQGLYGTAANDLWGAANSGRIGHYDGSNWTVEVPTGVTSQLFSVTGSGTHVWIVGDASTILHRD